MDPVARIDHQPGQRARDGDACADKEDRGPAITVLQPRRGAGGEKRPQHANRVHEARHHARMRPAEIGGQRPIGALCEIERARAQRQQHRRQDCARRLGTDDQERARQQQRNHREQAAADAAAAGLGQRIRDGAAGDRAHHHHGEGQHRQDGAGAQVQPARLRQIDEEPGDEDEGDPAEAEIDNVFPTTFSAHSVYGIASTVLELVFAIGEPAYFLK